MVVPAVFGGVLVTVAGAVIYPIYCCLHKTLRRRHHAGLNCSCKHVTQRYPGLVFALRLLEEGGPRLGLPTYVIDVHRATQAAQAEPSGPQMQMALLPV